MPAPRNHWISLGLLLGPCLNEGVADLGQEGPPVTVETITDEAFGRLVEFSDRDGARLSGDSNLLIRPADVLALRFARPTTADPSSENAGVVTLTEGSRFVYRSVDFLGERLRFTLSSDATLETSVNDLSEWQLQETAAENLGQTNPGAAADVLFVRRPQEETVPVSGVVLGLDEDGVRFALDTDSGSDPVMAPWKRIAGIRFYRGRAVEPVPPRAVIALGDGTRLLAESVSYQRGRLAWRSATGGGECPITSVASIDLSAGRVVPIARLEVISQQWKPFFGKSSLLKGIAFGQSLSGDLLTLRWPDHRAPTAWPAVHTVRSYVEGVAIRSDSDVRFVLPEGSQRLKGWAGIDPRTARVGSAEVAILAGDQPIWTGTIDGSTRPVRINAELPAARSLSIRVGYGDNLDAGDNVHFARLRVVR